MIDACLNIVGFGDKVFSGKLGEQVFKLEDEEEAQVSNFVSKG
jgi:hypothetical protein